MTPGANKRVFFSVCFLAGALLLVASVWEFYGSCDFLITDVAYLEGEQISVQTVDVGVKGGRISYIGQEPPHARTIIPGRGLILTPGFIDVNSCGWLYEEAAIWKLRDGITTFFNAHGDSLKADAKKFAASERLNYATSVGLIPVQKEHLTGERMMEALEGSLRYGAYTISLSPEYNLETTPAIVAELSRHFGGRGVLFTFHLRYSSESEELDGLREAMACAEAGNPIHILHISSTGASYHPEAAKAMIDTAIRRGLKISYDFYPYTAWSSSIHRARFSGDWQSRYKVDFSRVRVLGEADFSMKRFAELASDPQERNVIVDSIPQATVDYFALQTMCPIGTDSEASPATAHPRGVGSFTKFVNDYVDTGKVSFGQAMYRFTTATARQFEPFIPDLRTRGAIKVGYAADLVLWDRSKIKSNADYANPLTPSSGVVAAFVNGVPQILNGETQPDKRAGRHLKGALAGKP
jgi:N-acyl-D-amino-acid deacylase